jgi:hypothetical protein
MFSAAFNPTNRITAKAMLGAVSFRRPLLYIVVLGVIVRCSVLWMNYNSLELDASFVIHGEVARNIINGNGIVTNPTYMASVLSIWRTSNKLIDLEDIPPPVSESFKPLYNDEPGYGILLAAIWKITGSKRFIYVRLLQILIDLLMIVLIARIVEAVANRRAGFFAAGLYALFIPQIELVVRPHRDIWVTFSFIVSVYVFLRFYQDVNQRLGWKKLTGLGVLLGFVGWMRSTILAFAGFIGGLFFLLQPKGKNILRAAFLLGIFFLALSPLVIRNYQSFGKPMMTRGAFWHSFWAGIGQVPNPYGIIDNDEAIRRFCLSLDSTVQYDSENYEATLKKEAIVLLKEYPFWYATTIVRRAFVIVMPKIGRELFFQRPTSATDTGIHNKKFSPILLLIIDGMFALGLGVGIWLCRRKWREALLLAAPLLYTILALAPFYVVGRNILNCYFVTLCFTGITIDYLLTRFSSLTSRLSTHDESRPIP